MSPPSPGAGTPVLVGAAAIYGDATRSPVRLMVEAVEAAIDDAGAQGLRRRISRISLTQGSWSVEEPGARVRTGLGLPDGVPCERVEVGIPQQTLLNRAIAAIAADPSRVEIVLGGEARRFARESGGDEAGDDPPPSGPPDSVTERPDLVVHPAEVAVRGWVPVEQYAMVDTALAAYEGSGQAARIAEIAELWARFNAVARTNPQAAFPAPMDAAAIATPTAENRPMAHPYLKWHTSQWTVDQSAGLVLTSVEVARSLGVPSERWVFPHVGLVSSFGAPLVARRALHAWPGMGVLGRAAADHLGRPPGALDVHEVYSCFPSAVAVQQRELGLDPGGTPTLTGGMAFAGGPFNNYVFQATAAMVAHLRSSPREAGMVTTVSGLLTKPGLGVWSAAPPERPCLVADLAAEAGAATGVVPGVLDGASDTGEHRGTVATCTVSFDRDGPTRVLAIVDLDDGRRALVECGAPDAIAGALAGEMVGRPAAVRGTGFLPG